MNDEELAYQQIVFAITVQGYAELRSPASSLNLQERTVLTLVDGVCPVAQYLPFLRTFEPVVHKFRKLEQLGLLRRTGKVTSEAVKRFDEQSHSGVQPSRWHSISADQQASGFVSLS
jgi:hypothetical protein